MDKETLLSNGNYRKTLICAAFLSISYGMQSTVVAVHIKNNGMALTLVGVIVGVMSISSLVIRPVSGFITDNINKKYLLMISAAVYGMVTILIGFSKSFPIMFLLRIIQGVGFAISNSCSVALGLENVSKENIGKGIGHFSVVDIVSISVGPSLGTLLCECYGSRVAIIIAGILIQLVAVLMLSIDYDKKQDVTTVSEKTLDEIKEKLKFQNLFAKELFLNVFLTFAFALSNTLVSSFLGLIASEREISGYTVFFTINAVAMLAFRLFSGKIIDKRGTKIVISVSFFFAAATMFILEKADTLQLLCLAAVMRALGPGIGQPALQADNLKIVGSQRKGVAISMYYLGCDVAYVIGPIMGTVIADAYGYGVMCRVSGIVLLIALLALLGRLKDKTRRDCKL